MKGSVVYVSHDGRERQGERRDEIPKNMSTSPSKAKKSKSKAKSSSSSPVPPSSSLPSSSSSSSSSSSAAAVASTSFSQEQQQQQSQPDTERTDVGGLTESSEETSSSAGIGMKTIVVFAGSSHPQLTNKIVERLGCDKSQVFWIPAIENFMEIRH